MSPFWYESGIFDYKTLSRCTQRVPQPQKHGIHKFILRFRRFLSNVWNSFGVHFRVQFGTIFSKIAKLGPQPAQNDARPARMAQNLHKPCPRVPKTCHLHRRHAQDQLWRKPCDVVSMLLELANASLNKCFSFGWNLLLFARARPSSLLT